MSEKMRDGFESWCLANGYTLRPAETNCGIIIEGAYGHPRVQLAWQAWQASRAEMVAELPANCKGMALTVDELRVVLDEIGVTLK